MNRRVLIEIALAKVSQVERRKLDISIEAIDLLMASPRLDGHEDQLERVITFAAWQCERDTIQSRDLPSWITRTPGHLEDLVALVDRFEWSLGFPTFEKYWKRRKAGNSSAGGSR